MHLERVLPSPVRLPARASLLRADLWALVAFALLVASLPGWLLKPPSAPDLGRDGAIATSGLLSAWEQGAAMVIIRHAERCDRSHNPCLGDPEGITQAGAQVAASAGQALQALGLETADVLSSPLVRTLQTSRALTGQDVPTVEWLQDCRRPSLENLLALKKPGRNLVIVTHSGCIEHYERQLGVGGTPPSGYASGLFLANVHYDSASVLGYLNASGWSTLLAQVKK